MSAVLGAPTALTHDINPYIPELLRPHPVPTYHHSQHSQDVPSPHPSVPPPTRMDTDTFLPTRSLDPLRPLPSQPKEALLHQPCTFSTAAVPPRPPMCVRCHELILDHYLYRICGQTWHEACAVCSTCSAALSDVCFLHDGKLFCRRDYDRLHATKCVNCRQPMRSHELFMRARLPSTTSTSEAAPPPLIFHVSCFTCVVCQQPLAAGDPYTIDPVSHRPICREDFLAARHRNNATSPAVQPVPTPEDFPITQLSSRSCQLDDPSVATHNRTMGCNRRIRTSLTDDQRLHLQKAYEKCSRPTKHVRELLAKELDVPVRVVQVWFQNQRARDKRALLQRRRSGRSQSERMESLRHASIPPPSPTPIMTPSPRTSVESGGHYLDFSGFSGDDPGRLTRANETDTQPWMPASGSVWLVDTESQSTNR